MDNLKDNPRTFAEMDSDIQYALVLFIPGFVTFDRQVQVDDSFVFYQLNQEHLGPIGRIELVKRDSAHLDISMQNAGVPSETAVLNFLAFWKKEEHAEALSILMERARARNSKRGADYSSIPALKTATPKELNAHFDQALQTAERAKQELMKQQQAQLWAVTSIVLNRLNEETIWESERDSFSFKADLITFWTILEQTISTISTQSEPLEIARIQAMGLDKPSIEAVLFRPEMRAQGFGAILSARSLDDGTTLVAVRASENIWNRLQETWQKIRADLEQREPIPPSQETVIPEPVEIATPIAVPSTSVDSSLSEASPLETVMPVNIESAMPDQDLITIRNRRGKRSHYSQEERDQAVKDWEKTDKDTHAQTLGDFLAERFGDDESTGKLNVATRTFYEWRADFFTRNPKWTPEEDEPKHKRKRKSKKNL